MLVCILSGNVRLPSEEAVVRDIRKTPLPSPDDERESRDYAPPFRIAGSRGSRLSAPDAREDMDSVRPVADLMMGAAHADAQVSDEDRKTVHGLLCQLLGRDTLPGELEQYLGSFDPERFDLRSTAESFQQRSRTSDRRMLELVRKVCDADHTVDLQEADYMLGLVIALSMQPDDYADLVVRESRGVNGPLKRLEDLVLGGAALLVCALPMLLVAMAIKITSRGPVLFRQRRYGRGGREIGVLKFRTMRTADDGPHVRQAQQKDPRVTPVGAFLRRTSLDELPQLINVVRGDMSLIGPRPHAVAHNQLYEKQIIEYMLRHKVKPGITGWAQVHGWRGPTDTLRKMVYRVEYDLDYIRRWSLWLDLKILWLTLFGRRVRMNAH